MAVYEGLVERLKSHSRSPEQMKLQCLTAGVAAAAGLRVTSGRKVHPTEVSATRETVNSIVYVTWQGSRCVVYCMER